MAVAGLDAEEGLAAARDGGGEEAGAGFGRRLGRGADDAVRADRLERAPDGDGGSGIEVGVGPALGGGALRDQAGADGIGKDVHHQRRLQRAGVTGALGGVGKNLGRDIGDEVEVGEGGGGDAAGAEGGDRDLERGAVAAVAVEEDGQETVVPEPLGKVGEHGDEGLGPEAHRAGKGAVVGGGAVGQRFADPEPRLALGGGAGDGGGEPDVEAHRQVRPVLLDGAGRQDGDGAERAGGSEGGGFGRGQGGEGGHRAASVRRRLARVMPEPHP